jgi:hypothetical protein
MYKSKGIGKTMGHFIKQIRTTGYPNSNSKFRTVVVVFFAMQ